MKGNSSKFCHFTWRYLFQQRLVKYPYRYSLSVKKEISPIWEGWTKIRKLTLNWHSWSIKIWGSTTLSTWETWARTLSHYTTRHGKNNHLKTHKNMITKQTKVSPWAKRCVHIMCACMYKKEEERAREGNRVHLRQRKRGGSFSNSSVPKNFLRLF